MNVGISSMTEFVVFADMSSHNEESVGVQAVAREVRTDSVGERRTGEHGPKSSAMLETEV
jgi:hypothetical protein